VTQRRGFTMIEVLVACAVIVILMGLLFLGGRAIVNANKKSSTKATLANLKGMITEREAAAGATKAKDQIDAIFLAAPEMISANATPPPPYTPVDGSAIPKDYSENASARTPTDVSHLGRTQRVMGLLVSIPANRTSVQNLPPEQLLETVKTLGARPASPPVLYVDNQTPILLDAWGIPILAMPSSGVELQFETGTRVVRSPDGKPFFMSAGPDGIFNAADDNLFSFEN
jgi:prepilin-type N-terminal cleavage/methylation domain-containing protein